MNHKFKILWFEDEEVWFNAQVRTVKQSLEAHCLEADVQRQAGDEVEPASLQGNNNDLILMDYNLASDQTGADIISSIRAHDVLTDILFYSSQYDEMLAAIHGITPPVDGIYYSARRSDVFLPKVEKLIGKIVKRSEDLINLRGFVLDNSCDFEVRIKELLNIAWNKFSEPEKEVLEASAHEELARKNNQQGKNQNKIIAQPPIFPAAVNDKYFFTHADRLYLMEKVIEILRDNYGFPVKPEHCHFKGQYEANISQYRNALGHRKTGENSITVAGTPIPIDASLHQRMRKSITKYEALVSDIEVHITNQV